jgi:hypothetical protein
VEVEATRPASSAVRSVTVSPTALRVALEVVVRLASTAATKGQSYTADSDVSTMTDYLLATASPIVPSPSSLVLAAA